MQYGISGISFFSLCVRCWGGFRTDRPTPIQESIDLGWSDLYWMGEQRFTGYNDLRNPCGSQKLDTALVAWGAQSNKYVQLDFPYVPHEEHGHKHGAIHGWTKRTVIQFFKHWFPTIFALGWMNKNWGTLNLVTVTCNRITYTLGCQVKEPFSSPLKCRDYGCFCLLQLLFVLKGDSILFL